MTPEELQQQIDELKGSFEEYKKKVDGLYSATELPDEVLQNFVRNGFLRQLKQVEFTSGANRVFYDVFIDKENKPYVLQGTPSAYFVPFTAATSDTCTGAVSENDLEVFLETTGTLPSPLTTSTPYYTINATGTTFKLSASLGGVAVNITDIGTGTHYLRYS